MTILEDSVQVTSLASGGSGPVALIGLSRSQPGWVPVVAQTATWQYASGGDVTFQLHSEPGVHSVWVAHDLESGETVIAAPEGGEVLTWSAAEFTYIESDTHQIIGYEIPAREANVMVIQPGAILYAWANDGASIDVGEPGDGKCQVLFSDMELLPQNGCSGSCAQSEFPTGSRRDALTDGDVAVFINTRFVEVRTETIGVGE